MSNLISIVPQSKRSEKETEKGRDLLYFHSFDENFSVSVEISLLSVSLI